MISVVIPLYNKEKSVRATLESVRVQSYTDWECIVVDDGSTDRSGAILEEYKAKYPNVEVYNQVNQRQSVARNTGLDKAKGQYVLFLDSDDYYRNGAIAYLKGLIEKNPEVDFFYMDCAITTNGKRYYTLRHKEPVKMPLTGYHDYEYSQYGTTPAVCVWGGLYKRDFIERNHLRMFPNCRYEDELFIFEVFLKEGMCMALHVEEPYYYRVGREGSTTAKYTLTHFFNRRTIVQAIYEQMLKSNLSTEARKRKVFGMCEENLLQAYLYGFKNEIKKFFTKDEVRILGACAATERDEKLVTLAKISPKLLAAYRTGQLPNIVRRAINRFM